MAVQYDINKVPASHRRDVEKAVAILKAEGCEEIYLFGSIVDGPITSGSDIDIAVKGIPSGSFFHVLAKLLLQLDHPIDLVPLEKENRFSEMLQREGYLRRVA